MGAGFAVSRSWPQSGLRLVIPFSMALIWLCAVAAAQTLPALTGRVNDAAAILDASTKARLETKLKDLEDKSGIQLVVATVKSLDGQAIESYANNLFRAWKLGEKGKDNGVLFLIAPNDRKVRIEPGYGLEGTLTDAISKLIIVNAVIPRFKAGDYAGGIERGVDDIITTLTTDSAEWEKRPKVRTEDTPSLLDTLLPFLVFMIFVFVVVSMMRNAASGGGRMMRRGGNIVFIPTGGFGGGFGGGSGGGFGGGDSGFSGGGGSSGGGGASGSW
jgi:uncharacterized protein